MNHTKKILVLVPDLRLPGGVTNYYNALKLEVSANVEYFTVNSYKQESAIMTVFRMFKNYFRFFFLLIKKRFDIIHINPSLDRRSFYRDFGFIMISRVMRRKKLVFFRGWNDEYEEKIRKNKFRSYLFRISYAKADRYIVLSGMFKKKLIQMGVPASVPFSIETTVADSSFINELNLEKKYLGSLSNLQFLFISRIEKEKGVFIAIDAFNDFLTKNPGVHAKLVIAGDGPALPEAKKYVDEKKITGVEFLGNVRGEKKKKALLESHIMLFPTYYGEGMPNSVLEGMLYGMPVVSRNNAGIPDVVEHGVNGYLTDSIEPSVFTDFLTNLTSDKEILKKMAWNNNQKGIQLFTTEKVRDRILKIYEQV
ncbi:MAG TPA: glycosyltransferase family 4 protein [Chitinophagaceae bacterium]|nr:glycosyltransferase family 4 protein [Chitinophagaceae bacterium]